MTRVCIGPRNGCIAVAETAPSAEATSPVSQWRDNGETAGVVDQIMGTEEPLEPEKLSTFSKENRRVCSLVDMMAIGCSTDDGREGNEGPGGKAPTTEDLGRGAAGQTQSWKPLLANLVRVNDAAQKVAPDPVHGAAPPRRPRRSS